ncbi:tetratricopeptide repeat protein [Blautia stercoris]|uniref:tetratricopeptide repeat protein n=1 Tax=Blautia stercoris TaxID=871664 RepID=UPI002FE6E202
MKILDKKEYRARLDEINNLVEKQDYREALNVVETIEWRRVRSARTLCMVSEIYEVNKRYDDSLRLLLLAYQRAPSGKLILYRLVELSVKMTDYESAVKYYNQFMKLSPNDNNRYILKYKIYKGRKNPIEDQIKILEKYKASEYTERWAYELARLYARAGMYDKCIAECDEMVLWFSDGKYVKKALELKMKYTELTDAEKEKYKELYGEPKAVRIARTAASVSAATQAAAKMLNQTAQTMVKPEEAVNSVKAEAFQLPKPEAIKKAESGAGSEAKAEEEVKPELAEQPKIMKMPEFIKTPEVKPDFEPLPEIQMPEEIKKEIEEELEKKKEVEAKLQEETAKIAEEEPVKEFDLEAALGAAADEMVQEEKTEAVENEAEAKTEMEVSEGATIQLPLEEIKAARQNAVETDATVDLSNVVEEAMAEAVVTAEEETAEKAVEAETEASEEEVAEAETEEPQENEAAESVETEEQQEEKVTESAEPEPIEVEEARESEPAQWMLEEPVESEEENAEPEAEVAEEVEPEPEKVLRHHLTEEEHRRLFTYFAPIPGMKEQVKEALDIAQKSACEKTSKAGNMIVTGRSGSGKTRFSESLIKALCKERQMEGAKVAYLTAEVLNKKDPAFIVDKLSGGFLAIGRASAMTAQTVENLSKAMEFKTNRLTVILEDSKAGIYTLKQDYPEFMEKFDSRIVIPVFTNDELVSFAKTYAKEKGYKVDDIAVLAVYSLIGDNQYEDDPVCVGQVREMMDSAIAKASRLGRRPGKKVAKRHLDVTGRIMLYEKDFNL